MNRFLPRLDILLPAQRQLWMELGQVPAEFTLYGGTAIALHLGHRQSADFDFFGSRPFDPGTLQASIPFLAQARVIQNEKNTLTAILNREVPVVVSWKSAAIAGGLQDAPGHSRARGRFRPFAQLGPIDPSGGARA